MHKTVAMPAESIRQPRRGGPRARDSTEDKEGYLISSGNDERKPHIRLPWINGRCLFRATLAASDFPAPHAAVRKGNHK
jgi:hypothetical protein